MGANKPESSVVSASTTGGHDPSLLSLRTDKSSYSVPDDGRAITIETNHHHRRQKSSNIDTASALSAASQTSLLIEYFEGARGIGNSPSHRPSVRVKVTPSAQRKLNQQGTREIEIRGNEGRPGNRRNPSYTQRISLSPRVTGEDRLLIAGAGKDRSSRRAIRSRSISGEQHSAVSSRHVYDEDGQSVSSFSELSSLVNPNPLNVEVIRDGISPANESPRQRHNSSTVRNILRDRGINLVEGDDQSRQTIQRRRSRSLSNERETVLGDGSSKLSRKRSKSMDRERPTKEQREELREQRRLNKKLAELNGEKPVRRSRSREIKSKDKLLKSPREDKKNRSLSQDRSKSRTRAISTREEIRNVSGSSDISQNPQLLNAVEDAIKRLILPQLEALKGQHGHDSAALDQVATAAIAAEAARTFTQRASSPDYPKGSEGPLLVLQPDTDQGTGHGLVLAGEKAQSVGHRSESVISQAPGFGMGPDPDFQAGIEYYPVPKDHIARQAPFGERVRMPSIPDMSHFNVNSEVSREVLIEDDDDQRSPYPQVEQHHGSDIGMPISGHTPPALASPLPVAPLNLSRHNTPARGMASPSPRPSVASLRRKFDGSYTSDVGDVEILSPQRTGRAGSNLSMNTISTMPDSRLTMNTENKMNYSPGVFHGDISRTIEDDDPVYQQEEHRHYHQAENPVYQQEQHRHYHQEEIEHEHDDEHDHEHNLHDHNHHKLDHDRLEQEVQQMHDHDRDLQHQEQDRMNWWFDREHGTYEQRSELETRDGQFEEQSNNRNSVADSFEQRHLSRVAAGQGVKDVGALASMRSTPVAQSHRASVHDHLSTVSLQSQPPQFGFSAVPVAGEDFPELGHYQSEIGDEDDMLTNPYGGERNSRELAPGDDTISNPYAEQRHSRALTGDDILTNPYGGERDSRELGEETWNYEEHQNNHDSFGLRVMQGGGLANKDQISYDDLDAGIDRNMAITPQKDEGYMSGANAMSPGMETPKSMTRELENFRAIDDVISEAVDDDDDDDEDFVPFRGHNRGGSGNSHGMPSPLYDSSLGRGIDRIQSKDIVALMDHVSLICS